MEFKSRVINLNCHFILQILVLEDDVDLYLSLIVLIADFEEVVIDDLLQVDLLDALQLSQDLLELFLPLVVQEHDSLFSLKDPREEPSPSSDHLSYFRGLLTPLINELWQRS